MRPAVARGIDCVNCGTANMLIFSSLYRKAFDTTLIELDGKYLFYPFGRWARGYEFDEAGQLEFRKSGRRNLALSAALMFTMLVVLYLVLHGSRAITQLTIVSSLFAFWLVFAAIVYLDMFFRLRGMPRTEIPAPGFAERAGRRAMTHGRAVLFVGIFVMAFLGFVYGADTVFAWYGGDPSGALASGILAAFFLYGVFYLGLALACRRAAMERAARSM